MPHESDAWPTGWKQTRDDALTAMGAGQPAPTIARAVHYVIDGACKAATVVDTTSDTTVVGLTYLDPLPDYRPNVAHDENRADGTWHWPERV